MRVGVSAAPGLARLLAWDAAVLPVVEVAGAAEGGATLELDAAGATLQQAARWPRGQRTAVALQLVAAGTFLFERGWYPSRAMLRGCRVRNGPDGPWLRLGALPSWRLDDPRLARRMGAVFGAEENVVRRTVAPLLRLVLPECARDFERAVAARPAWEAAAAWLGVLLDAGRERAALRHPAGAGRALWARRFRLPEVGTFWVEEEALLPALASAARLATLGKAVSVEAGALEEEDVARLQARAAAAGRDLVALTTLTFPGVRPLPLDGGIESVWVLAERSEAGLAHAGAAVEVGARRPAFARTALERGAADGFVRPPTGDSPPEGLESLASPAARRAMAWLASAPVGLEAAEIGALAGTPESVLPEIERLRLAQQRSGAWCAVQTADEPESSKLDEMATRLPGDSAAGAVARSLARGEWRPAAVWCEERLRRGAFREALAVAHSSGAWPALRKLAAEGALGLGRLADAEAALEAVAPAERDAAWHALAAWWAEGAGLPERAAAELAAGGADGLPGRLAARRELVAAELARRAGDRTGEEAHLRAAVAGCDPALADAELLLADFRGPQALRELRRSRAAGWSGDLRARALHLAGSAAFARGAWAAGSTALRAALRVATGENPRLLGEVHGDLGYAAMFAERPAVADRHLKLAEGILERCGSRRAATVVRANRAVLACDRLDVRQARELTLAARELRGAPDDTATWLGEIELARIELGRGDVATVELVLPQLEAACERHRGHRVMAEALAGLRAHLALASGNLAGAAAAAVQTDAGEGELIDAVIAADEGHEPAAGLPQRWGVAVTAHLLAAWRRGEGKTARAWLLRALERSPREAAVGLARLVTLLAGRGERLDPAWAECERRAEAALAAAGLDGWAERLRAGCGVDPVRVVEALDDVLNAGTDWNAAARLEALGRALGVRGFALERGGRPVAAWGEPGADAEELVADGVTVRFAAAEAGVAAAALRMIARHLALHPDAATAGDAPALETAAGATMRAVREEIARWAPLPLTVLVTGEPGTGKELVARELHAASGRRGPFLAVNCAGIPSSLLEAELFGVVRGAFTGADRDRAGLVEAAEGGTLFLDEVGELPLELQGKLLRLLQEREVRRVGATRSRVVDVRFLAATNRDLGAAVAAGTFRQDLYYRLAVAVIEVPPLRERPEDIETLARAFAARLGTTLGRPGVRLAPAAVAALRRGAWPGNVRELESVVVRAVAAARPGEVLGPDRFPEFAPAADAPRRPRPWPEAADAFRRAYFTELLAACDGNRTRAAREAGISRQTLLYHLRELGIRGGADV
ncbi:MAG TPA: sigma 54-interacting transcriptional regulator [Thermoanaerobaculaceae bacterium]|nr:sigma 54-interacting transcriptional regulator [Thermoanaerobaculaceae bacterium]